MIYMDNAATTMRKPETVIQAVVDAMTSMGNAGRGANEASLSASRIIFDTRDRLCNVKFLVAACSYVKSHASRRGVIAHLTRENEHRN